MGEILVRHLDDPGPEGVVRHCRQRVAVRSLLALPLNGDAHLLLLTRRQGVRNHALVGSLEDPPPRALRGVAALLALSGALFLRPGANAPHDFLLQVRVVQRARHLEPVAEARGTAEDARRLARGHEVETLPRILLGDLLLDRTRLAGPQEAALFRFLNGFDRLVQVQRRVRVHLRAGAPHDRLTGRHDGVVDDLRASRVVDASPNVDLGARARRREARLEVVTEARLEALSESGPDVVRALAEERFPLREVRLLGHGLDEVQQLRVRLDRATPHARALRGGENARGELRGPLQHRAQLRDATTRVVSRRQRRARSRSGDAKGRRCKSLNPCHQRPPAPATRSPVPTAPVTPDRTPVRELNVSAARRLGRAAKAPGLDVRDALAIQHVELQLERVLGDEVHLRPLETDTARPDGRPLIGDRPRVQAAPESRFELGAELDVIRLPAQLALLFARRLSRTDAL